MMHTPRVLIKLNFNYPANPNTAWRLSKLMGPGGGSSAIVDVDFAAMRIQPRGDRMAGNSC